MDRYFSRSSVESSEKRARIDSNEKSDDVVSDRSQCGDRMRCFQAEWFNK